MVGFAMACLAGRAAGSWDTLNYQVLRYALPIEGTRQVLAVNGSDTIVASVIVDRLPAQTGQDKPETFISYKGHAEISINGNLVKEPELFTFSPGMSFVNDFPFSKQAGFSSDSGAAKYQLRMGQYAKPTVDKERMIIDPYGNWTWGYSLRGFAISVTILAETGSQ